MQTQNRHPLPPLVAALFESVNPASPLALATLREAVEQMHHESTSRELEEAESATTQGEIAAEWSKAARRLAAEIVRRDPIDGPATVERLAGNVMDGSDTEEVADLVLDAIDDENADDDQDEGVPCVKCCDGSAVSNVCGDCGERHCPACDPCDDEEGL